MNGLEFAGYVVLALAIAFLLYADHRRREDER